MLVVYSFPCALPPKALDAAITAPAASRPFGGLPAAPARRAAHTAAESHRCFTCLENERLMRVMQRHPYADDASEWEEIADEMGCGFTPRQLMDRWYYYLRPGVCREEFTPEERRECLRLAFQESWRWSRVAAQMNCGRVRTCAQVKSVVNTLLARLQRFCISLQHPDDISALPDEFFKTVVPIQRGPVIKKEFICTRIAQLQDEIKAEQQSRQ
jgi:hypothetical protein